MSLLETAVRGKIEKPHLVLLYGPDGVGKTTFAAGAPNVIFLGAENGTNTMDVERLPGLDSFDKFKQALSELATEKHNYKTVVIDTLDWLEMQIHRHVVKREKKDSVKSIEDFGYGKGYAYALDEWKQLIPLINEIREKGINVILLAHSKIKTFQDPSTPQGYDRYMLKLHDGASALLREFVDTVLFANHLTTTSDEDKKRGFSDGSRVVYTERRAGFDAKNRFGLPDKMRFPKLGGWELYEKATQASNPADTESIMQSINGLLDQVKNPETKKQAEEAIKKAEGNASKLAEIKTKLTKLVG